MSPVVPGEPVVDVELVLPLADSSVDPTASLPVVDVTSVGCGSSSEEVWMPT